MKTKSELTNFYYKTLYPSLEDLELQRKQIKKSFLQITSVLLLISSLLALYFINFTNSKEVLFFIFFIFIFISAILYNKMTSSYTKKFKNLIIEPLIKEINENFRYNPEKHISPTYFNRANFFTSKPDRTSGNDYVSGIVDDVKVTFSDFHAEKKHTDSKGRTSWSTMFQGLFVMTQFPKNFHGSTLVLPDLAQNALGNYLGSLLQKHNFSRKQLIKMDNIAFEKKFVVYGDDQIEARYILTPLLMEKILHFQKRSQAPLYLSFKSNQMYMGISYNKDMFEPSVFRSLLEYKIAMEYVNTLHLLMGVVEELKLNQKLWSKL